MEQTGGRSSLAAMGESSLYRIVTGSDQNQERLHQASYDVKILKEVLFLFGREHWPSSFGNFVLHYEEQINVIRICSGLEKTRRKRKQKKDWGLVYL